MDEEERRGSGGVGPNERHAGQSRQRYRRRGNDQHYRRRRWRRMWSYGRRGFTRSIDALVLSPVGSARMAALDVSLQMARQDAYVADRCQDSEHDEHEQHWRAPSHRSSKVHALLRACQRAYRYRDWVRLVSGNGVDHTRRFRDIAAANSKLSARSIVLDGEVAIYDQQLRSRFDGLSESAPDARRLPADRHQAELMRIEHRAVAVYWGPLSLSH